MQILPAFENILVRSMLQVKVSKLKFFLFPCNVTKIKPHLKGGKISTIYIRYQNTKHVSVSHLWTHIFQIRLLNGTYLEDKKKKRVTREKTHLESFHVKCLSFPTIKLVFFSEPLLVSYIPALVQFRKVSLKKEWAVLFSQ